MSDLDGRRFVVTGANTGIGRAVALELARRGGSVVLACRSEAKTVPVVEDIKRETGNEGVSWTPLDLADLHSVRRCAASLAGSDDPLHVLVNNAGVGGQRGQTADGFEIHFGVNHLGHFLLTTLLLDKLRASAPGRIVNVSSGAHFQARGVDFDAVRRSTATFIGFREYGVSKLCNVLFTQELARRLEGSGVTAYAVHPGGIASDIWRRIPWPLRQLMLLPLKSTEQGALSTLRCATDPGLAAVSGRYYDDAGHEQEASRRATTQLAAELWRRSEEWTRA